MYVLHTSDIPVAETTMATFARDTVILSVARTENEAKHRLKNALTSVLEWIRKWCLKLNSCKSTHVDFTNKSTSGIPIFMNGVQILHKNVAKYLDMTLDVKLRWNEHVKLKIIKLQLK